MPGIPNSCRPIVTFPILWTRTMAKMATSFSAPVRETSSLFDGRPHSRILQLLRTFFSLSYLLASRNGSVFLLGPCHVFVVQSLAFSFRLSKVGSLILTVAEDHPDRILNPLLTVSSSLSPCRDVFLIHQNNSVKLQWSDNDICCRCAISWQMRQHAKHDAGMKNICLQHPTSSLTLSLCHPCD